MSGFIVVYDDDDSLCVPFGWNDGCEGALCCAGSGPVAMFDTRKQAQQAINISKAYARLCGLQGRLVNTDFTEHSKCIKIVPLAKEPQS